MGNKPDRIHIYPVYGRNRSTHKTNKSCACWCEPEYMQVCPESDERGNCVDGCYRCGGRGLVRPYDDTLPMLIEHREGQLTKKEEIHEPT